jgi:hypothetical protein
MAARVARKRGAKFRRGADGVVGPADAASRETLAEATRDVVAWLGYTSVEAFDAATPEARRVRFLAVRARPWEEA